MTFLCKYFRIIISSATVFFFSYWRYKPSYSFQLNLFKANRDENQGVNEQQAVADAEGLIEAGEAKWGTEESVFNAILITRSYQQLRATFAEYERLTGKDIEQVIKKEFSGSIQKGLLGIGRAMILNFKNVLYFSIVAFFFQ